MPLRCGLQRRGLRRRYQRMCLRSLLQRWGVSRLVSGLHRLSTRDRGGRQGEEGRDPSRARCLPLHLPPRLSGRALRHRDGALTMPYCKECWLLCPLHKAVTLASRAALSRCVHRLPLPDLLKVLGSGGPAHNTAQLSSANCRIVKLLGELTSRTSRCPRRPSRPARSQAC